MHFLCDAHITLKLVSFFEEKGFKSKHVNSLPLSWNTPDDEICKVADAHDYTLVTKDVDFRDSYFINQTPKKLIRVLLGNISNKQLLEVFSKYLPVIEKYDERINFYIEIDKDGLFVIDKN